MEEKPLPPPTVQPSLLTKSKDMRAVKVIVMTMCCNREHFYPDGDPRQRCHLKLEKLDLAICPNCIHFGDRPPAPVKVLTDGEAMAVMGTLETLKQTHDAEIGEQIALELARPGE